MFSSLEPSSMESLHFEKTGIERRKEREGPNQLDSTLFPPPERARIERKRTCPQTGERFSSFAVVDSRKSNVQHRMRERRRMEHRRAERERGREEGGGRERERVSRSGYSLERKS